MFSISPQRRLHQAQAQVTQKTSLQPGMWPQNDLTLPVGVRRHGPRRPGYQHQAVLLTSSATSFLFLFFVLVYYYITMYLIRSSIRARQGKRRRRWEQ
jgi:hypothetical protein